MTRTQTQHLEAILTRIDKLLLEAEKRTPGAWSESPNSRAVYQETYQVAYTGEANGNATFIASCAGNAEAGWRTTKKLISFCQDIDDGSEEIEGLIESIIKEWPIELLT